ncbi:alanine racemase [Martelella soudanensis]|uniref:alanine racemase n=1 Tax=unclassified Martelella TaxID=2629616 RepID=UPI0015DFCC2B|nr:MULTISPECIES: alanine racemase [unclassified Martelella]
MGACELSRPNQVVVDARAFASNLECVRRLIPDGTEIWQVCKGDGYGLGLRVAMELGIANGISQFCAGTPEEALLLKDIQPDARVLLFPAALPEDIGDLSASGIIVTAHNSASLEAVLRTKPDTPFFIKVDTGLHRYGFGYDQWQQSLETYRGSGHGGLCGIYTHFGQNQADNLQPAIAAYDRFLDLARATLGSQVSGMASASHSLFSAPDLGYARVDPGRALYGMLSPEETHGSQLQPVVSKITSRLLEVRALDKNTAVPIGYGGADFSGDRIGVFPIGHFDGLPFGQPLGSVFIRGREAPVIARTLLASIVDLGGIAEAQPGDEVVLVGQSGALSRDLFAFAATLKTNVTALHFGFIRNLPKTLKE